MLRCEETDPQKWPLTRSRPWCEGLLILLRRMELACIVSLDAGLGVLLGGTVGRQATPGSPVINSLVE